MDNNCCYALVRPDQKSPVHSKSSESNSNKDSNKIPLLSISKYYERKIIISHTIVLGNIVDLIFTYFYNCVERFTLLKLYKKN